MKRRAWTPTGSRAVIDLAKKICLEYQQSIDKECL
jgi:hypothetical protein